MTILVCTTCGKTYPKSHKFHCLPKDTDMMCIDIKDDLIQMKIMSGRFEGEIFWADRAWIESITEPSGDEE